MKKFLLTAMALCVVTVAQADLLLDDSFAYSDGTLTNVAVPPWVIDSSAGSDRFDITSEQLVKSSSSGETIGRQFTNTTSGTDFYFSFTLNFSSLAGDGTNRMFAGLSNGSGFTGRMGIGATSDGATSGGYFLGIGDSITYVDVFGTTELALDTTYTLVGYYSNDDGTTKLWIDPTAETDAAYCTGTGSTTSGTDGFIYRASSSGGVATFDDLLVGETFADVVAVPEPATLGFMGVGLLAAFIARRRLKA